MTVSDKPSHIPLPSASSSAATVTDTPPSPSAFPSLPSTAAAGTASGGEAHSGPVPVAQPGISYAKASKSLLPPTSAPQGTSLPPPPHPPKDHQKERLQPSQNGRDSPYARGSAKKKPAPAHRRSPSHPHAIPPPPPAPANTAAADPAIPAIGKKRRQSLRKVLPPTASRLSPFAASFEFAPRSAHSGESNSGASSDEHELLSAKEKRDIAETVASAGAQGDQFRAKSFSQADAEGAVEAAGLSPGEQSARANKPTAASDANGSARARAAATLPVDEPRSDRPLGAFLGEAFAHADGDFAPLALPETDADQTGPEALFQEKQVTIPGAVQVSPVADLAWRERRGWWSEDYDPLAVETPTLEHDAAPPADPAAAAPAAVESAQAQTYEPVLRFPAWTPAPVSAADAAASSVGELVAPENVPQLATYLGTAFSDAAETADLPLSAEAVAASAPAPASAPSGALAAFLGSSFAPPLEGGWAAFEPLDERRAEALAAAGPLDPAAVDDVDFPLSAEAVAAQPTLDDVLDVDIEGDKVQPPPAKAAEKRGWWSDDATQAGGTLLSAEEQRAIQKTVGSAGAQGDEFRAKSFAQADSEGEPVATATSAREQSAKPDKPTALPGAEEGERSGAQTPLGGFLGQAFSGELAPSSAQPVASTSVAPPAESASASTPAAAPAAPRRSSSPSPPPSPSRSHSNSHNADSAPSLTLALASAWHTAPWSRKVWALVASLAINVGLPFVNGVMLGFGELFARNWIGVRLGWPLSPSSSSSSSPARANTSGVGLRAAGKRADVPGHAGAKTAVEAAEEMVREAAE